MGRRKRKPMSEGKKNIIGILIDDYDAKDIKDTLKDLLGGTIQGMIESEMNEHLGYYAYERSDNTDCRNGKNFVGTSEKPRLKYHHSWKCHLF